MTVQKINIDDAEMLFRGRMGLIFGPGITVQGDFYADLAVRLFSKWGGQPEHTYLQNAQHALDSSAHPNDIKGIVLDCLKSQKRYAHVNRIAALKWSAALSLTLDSIFEDELSRESERRTSGFIATQIVEFPQPMPPKTTPIFKLLGNVEQHFLCSDISYKARRPTWRYAVQDFADTVRENPVVCLGLEGCSWVFLDLLSQILSERRTILHPLILIESEFSKSYYTSIVQLAQEKLQIALVDTPLTALVSRLKDHQDAGATQPLPLHNVQSQFDRLNPFQDIVSVVNTQLTSSISSGERVQLLDLLFSPNLPCWDPFFHKLDFKRSIATQMLDTVLKPVRVSRTLPVFTLIGSAASGKTTVAKRLAYDLASKGHLVFWFRRTFYPNLQALLGHFFKALADITDKKTRIFFFVDDPIGIGSISMSAIALSAQTNNINCTFIVTARTSDWKTHDSEEITGTLDLARDFHIGDQFDPQELQSLPNYLVALQIYSDKQKAQAALGSSNTGATADTLALLYWLVPKTRQAIESSIQEEYLRLGDKGGLSRVIIGAYNKTSAFLRQAYALAAVSDYYRTPVPVEVLVSALNVSYHEWMDAVCEKGPAWGLLYAEYLPDGTTTSYRPRNYVVTRTLVDTINGGRLGRSGEVEHLLTLFRACTGTSLVYREYCVGMLVPRTKLAHLDYADGLQLYDTALAALPLDDRTLKHQKGLWIKDKGNDPLLAKSVLESALAAKSYPYTDRVEADEHIHTSLAATILDLVDQGNADLDGTLPEILHHLDLARSDSFFNPRAVHVQANLMLRVISRLTEQNSADAYNLLNQAINDVDSALLLLKNSLRNTQERPTKDIDFLVEISAKLYGKILPFEELSAIAEDQWLQFKRQEGFVVAARKLYNIAREKNSGTSYNEAFAYCNRVIETVSAQGQTPSGDLCAVAVCSYYDWNVNRYDNRVGGRQIDWPRLLVLAETVLNTAKYSGDPFYKFVSALALVEQNEWPKAEPIFAQIRRAQIPNQHLFEPRAVLLDDQGIRKRVQGIITGDADKHYLKVEGFGRDFLLSRYENWPRQDEIAHAYIAIAFAGPLAIQSV